MNGGQDQLPQGSKLPLHGDTVHGREAELTQHLCHQQLQLLGRVTGQPLDVYALQTELEWDRIGGEEGLLVT